MRHFVYSGLALLLMGGWVGGCIPRMEEDFGASSPKSTWSKPSAAPLPEEETASKATNVKLKIVAPREGQVIETDEGTVEVQLALENYEIMPGGQHIHVILDNEAYQAHYDITEPCVFKGVANGWHCLRVFPSRPWHESIKPQFSADAFQMVQFYVVPPSRVHFDARAPLLTYSRPKGEYDRQEAKRILLDFQVLNCQLSEDGYRVRYQVVPAGQGREARGSASPEEGPLEPGTEVRSEEEKTGEEGWTYISSWPPAPGEKLPVLERLNPGDWTVILELVDQNNQLVGANEWNHSERTITVK